MDLGGSHISALTITIVAQRTGICLKPLISTACQLSSTKFTVPRKTRDGSEIVLGSVQTDEAYDMFFTDFMNLETRRKAPEILKISKKQIKRTSEYARAGNYKATAYCFRKTTATKTDIFIRVYDEEFELSKMKFSNFIQGRFS